MTQETQDFTTQAVADGVWYIEDTQGGVMYLVAGSERALLIDTGWGTGDLAAHVATLTPLPLLVVNTHGHRDHTGGNDQFPEVHIHTHDLDLVEEGRARLTPVHDGFVFELGDRPVRAISVPGHSPGSICLLDRRARILFSGDSPRPGPVWLHLPTSTTVFEFHHSMRRLRSFAGEFDTLAPAHGTPQPVGDLLDDLVGCCGEILSGELTGEWQETRFGSGLLAQRGSAAIMYLADRVQRPPGVGRRGLASPEVHDDSTVTFRVKAPHAKRVLLRSVPVLNALGSADDAMALRGPDSQGVWSLTVGPLPSDIYDYVFEIDGVGFADPSHDVVQTGVMAPRSLVMVPPESGEAYYEVRDVAHGTLHHHRYRSRTVGDVRDVTVYTPPGYEANADGAYPTLYLLHGAGDDAWGWSSIGRLPQMTDNLLAEGRARPMVVVMPLGHAAPRTGDWAAYRVANTAQFEADLFAGIMPLVESTYRVGVDRRQRGIIGLSMGGGQAEHIGLSHLDVFATVGILSSGMADVEERHAALLADAEATNEQLDLLFLGCGTLDTLAMEGMACAHEVLTEAGVEHVYWTLEGAAHTWVVWRRALYEAFLPKLFRRPSPDEPVVRPLG